ncbi:hypothetical protein WJX81_001475 [Elliptochloris bilobata]|uniref:adenylate kinase n=1 Tax=Elliptochloris bilobata TaxID=381761 RepID=A0AAW1QTY0_9CHLO
MDLSSILQDKYSKAWSASPLAGMEVEARKKKFFIGTAISVYQNSGDPASQWDHFQGRRVLCGLLPSILNNDRVGKSTDFWDRYEADLRLARDLGSNAFRFSIEWSRIEPARGQICAPALLRYHKMVDCMISLGMEPMATLHHFVHPQWFEELGAFEREENIALFLAWCRLAFQEFGGKVSSWCTFNEPGVYTFSGYCMGGFPPAKAMHLRTAGRVLKHMLIAHTDAYRLIKGMPGGERAQVGIVHNWMPYEAKRSRAGRFVWWPSVLMRLADRCWGNREILDFLRTGVLDWRPMGPCTRVRYAAPGGPPPTDWVGLNYYSRVVMDWRCQVVAYPWEKLSDLRQAIHPEGFYNAIKEFSKVEKPIFITETGIADARDTLRAEWAEAYFRAVEHAIADGHDVRSFLYWTLVDNFEWAFGWAPRFGLYAWDHADPEQKRVERKSTATVVRRLFKSFPARVEELWAQGSWRAAARQPAAGQAPKSAAGDGAHKLADGAAATPRGSPEGAHLGLRGGHMGSPEASPPSRSGKGTQCAKIVDKYGYVHLSAGDLLREEVKSGSALGRDLEAAMKEGKLVPTGVTAEVFENEVLQPQLVLFFDCPEDEMVARLLERGKTSGRSDDNEDTIRKRFETFHKASMPVVERYEAKQQCVRVSAVPPPDAVFAEVCKAMDALGTAEGSHAGAAAQPSEHAAAAEHAPAGFGRVAGARRATQPGEHAAAAEQEPPCKALAA